MSTSNHNLLIVSDLHLSEGQLPTEGKLSPLEDFVSDQAFADFLTYHQNERKENPSPWKLVVAGDMFDFLQVTTTPAHTAKELLNILQSPPLPPTSLIQTSASVHQTNLKAWLDILSGKIKPTSSGQQLQACAAIIRDLLEEAAADSGKLWQLERYTLEALILANQEENSLTPNQQTYGLGTTWEETIWKLERIIEGHPLFFNALVDFLKRGNKLLILLGNHDVELIWDEVQDYLSDLLIANKPDSAADDTLEFKPWYHLEPDLIYIEHGNQYEGANAFESMVDPRLEIDDKRIDLPSGSLLVRYLFNKIEEAYPYADNLRPITRFFSWAIQNKLLTLITIMLRYFGPFLNFMSEFFFKAIKKWWNKEWWFKEKQTDKVTLADYEKQIDEAAREIRRSMFKRLQTAVVLLLVALLIGLTLFPPLYQIYIFAETPTQTNFIRSVVVSLLSLIFNQTVAPWLLRYITGDNYLEDAARQINNILDEQGQAVPYIVFGHDHNPNLVYNAEENKPYWYINTGSWLYHQGTEEGWLQQKKYYSFLKIVRGQRTSHPQLLRWDPEIGKPIDLRLRLKPPKHELIRRCQEVLKQLWAEMTLIHFIMSVLSYLILGVLLILLLLNFILVQIKENILSPIFRWIIWAVCKLLEFLTWILRWLNKLLRIIFKPILNLIARWRRKS